MTQQQWIERWKRHLVGGFSCGYDAARKLSPADAHDWHLKQVEYIEVMMGLMFDTAQPINVKTPVNPTPVKEVPNVKAPVNPTPVKEVPNVKTTVNPTPPGHGPGNTSHVPGRPAPG